MEEFVKELWETFHKALLNYIKKRISNPEDAEDILQNVFVKIQTNIHQLKEKEKVTSWLYLITRNTIIDTYRANGKHREQTAPNMEGNLDNVSLSDETQEAAWEAEIAACVKGMVEELPEKYRDVLKWYEFDGLSHKQIADKLAISVSGSKTRVQRSREKIKELLLCGCRVEGEFREGPSPDSPPVCGHLVKRAQADLCMQKLKTT